MPNDSDILPDMSQELAALGRGSLMVRITKLEAALDAAKDALLWYAADNEQGQEARNALYLMKAAMR